MVKYLRNGPAVVVLAFVLWGLIPLFYQYLSGGALAEILLYRVVCSIPLLLPIRLLFRKRTLFRDLLKDKSSFISCMIAGLLMVVSWSAFIYALTNHKVLDASLGYFINPLFVICLGCIFLKEKLSFFQIIAVLSGVCGLAYQIFSANSFPVLALVMGFSFALYGLARKFIHYDAITSITLETFWALPVALFIFIYTDSNILTSSDIPLLFYILTAPVTVIPLVLFAVALNHTSLIVTGLAQYIEPSLQFIIAILIFRESVNYPELFCFSAVWFGLLLCIIESLYYHCRYNVPYSEVNKTTRSIR
ncbi:EamA family transporter RarD [Salmonella enterica]|uniref:EamA family transporter RarD n=1 Tax=Salmonella enterica TaxID=28901 RepID=UPI001283CED4|nr:EamA family transporter RarD [Salmonella enterica]EBS0167848.1 EamA family transporter RarD [Salmonella enterica subsp. enterica serovar Typhimurium]EBS6729778.1 EamA family transporter RarD [Salmonella enterica subsp. enterica serovar Enteritidis]ECJ5046331.1 EamA family transporter RarD [Salmonella enterica subsp. enterica]ECO3308290.1 EamA family transporter RarD [Salmonella enterica subsp. enterica serovar Bareilly]EDQ3906823.1 EamA family transporter RarD [Salmonella enterica subsp. ho